MGKPFKNPPLKEALLEIRFPAELSIECQRDKFYKKIRKEYPQILVPQIGPFDSPSLRSYEFRNDKNTRVIKCSINSMSFHSAEYGDYQIFEKECIKYVQIFLELFNIKLLNRIGLRYINHIPVIRVNGLIPISKFLTFNYSLPVKIPSQIEFFHTILITKLGEGKLKTVIQSIADPKQTEYINLDLDHFYDFNIDSSEFKSYLSKSHGYIKDDIFLNLLSKEYLQALEKGA